MRQDRVSPVGRLLRQWRAVKNMSQLDLALAAGVSARHLSFVETGRSKPSREMVLLLSEVLEVPLRERNVLLGAAGYAHIYCESTLSDPELAQVRKVLRFILDRHEPYAALLLDRHWNIRMQNQASSRLLSAFIDPAVSWWATSPNSVRLLLHPEGLRPYVVNWEQVAQALMSRLYRASNAPGTDEETEKLLEEFLSYPEVRRCWNAPIPETTLEILTPIHLKKEDLELKLFTSITSLGTPQDITLQELRIECLFPADEASDRTLARIGQDT